MSLLDDVSIVVTPNGYKAGELYAVIPTYNLGNDLITNGDFTSNITGWGNAFLSSVPTLSWNSGKARITNTTGTNYNTGLQTTNNPFAGLTGRVKVTGNIQIISGAIIGAWTGREQYGAVAVFTLDGAGYFEFELSLDGTTDDLSIYAFASNLVFEIDNIVAKEITSADMDVTRATAATRVDENGLVNYAEVIGGEEVTNGDFSGGSTGWVIENTWTISSGVADGNGAVGSTSELTQTPVNTIGKTYKATFEVLNYVSGTVGFWQGSGVSVIPRSANGIYTEYFTATSTQIRFRPNIFNGSITNVSVKEVIRDNVPRIDYTGGGCPHILAEPQRTNLITYSEDFTQSSWASSNISSGISTVLSPDGTTFSYKLTNDAVSGNHFIRDNSTVTSGVPYTLSVFIKKGTRDIVSIGDGNSVNILANFDLTNGTSTNVSATSSSIESFNDGWFKCIATITPTTTTLGLMIFSGTIYAGKDESGYFYVWGGQVENGSYATSYIRTSGSTVTRNQDIFTRDGIGSLINSTEGVLFVEIQGFSNVNLQRIISLSDGDNNVNTVQLGILNSTTNYKLFASVRVSSSFQAFMVYDLGAVEPTMVKAAIKYKENDFALWVDGVERVTDTEGSTFSADTLNELAFDRGGGSQKFEGKVKQLQVYDTSLSDTQLAALTS